MANLYGWLAIMTLVGCTYRAEHQSNCGPASQDYLERYNSSCIMQDGSAFRLSDGQAAPVEMVCTDDAGVVVESWCVP